MKVIKRTQHTHNHMRWKYAAQYHHSICSMYLIWNRTQCALCTTQTNDWCESMFIPITSDVDERIPTKLYRLCAGKIMKCRFDLLNKLKIVCSIGFSLRRFISWVRLVSRIFFVLFFRRKTNFCIPKFDGRKFTIISALINELFISLTSMKEVAAVAAVAMEKCLINTKM